MGAIKVFWMEPANVERVWLRRYRATAFRTPDGDVLARQGCPLPGGYHDTRHFLKDRPLGVFADSEFETDPDRPSDDSPVWPTHCDCGFAFQEDDPFQLLVIQLYRGAPDGKLYTLQDAPPGAMWDADWLHEVDWARGPDGLSLHVKLPNGHDWCVDQEASNCTRTQFHAVDKRTKRWTGRTHYCWIRHGDPKTGLLHVDKNGETCKAGAGSILAGKWHGFLHHGHLVGA